VKLTCGKQVLGNQTEIICENMGVSNAVDQPNEPETEVSIVEERVEVVRSVRFGRVIIGGAIVGAVIATALTLSFPVASQDYTLGQVTGFMALVGATLGLALGSVLALILNRAVSNRRGTAVAKHSDVG
jgi:hypothetical protein